MAWKSHITLLSVLIAVSPLHAKEISVQSAIQCFQAAYPQTVQVNDGALIVNGHKLVPGKSHHSDYSQRLNTAGLLDQLEQIYPLDFPVPKLNEDPGRLRNEAAFAAMYGENEAAVRKNLISVRWMPSGGTVLFNRVNGAAEKLEAVGRELAADPELRHYASKTAGSFNYRVISGTNRRSAHAFGVAIDFSLPKNLGTYWKWAGCKEGKSCSYPQALRQDATLKKMVSVFEKYGFVWGGKWYNYDSVHFEYRPELLIQKCRSF